MNYFEIYFPIGIGNFLTNWIIIGKSLRESAAIAILATGVTFVLLAGFEFFRSM